MAVSSTQMMKKKGPDAPERNKSATNPDAELGEIAHIVSRHFKELSKEERSHWDEKAAQDKVHYGIEMESYRATKRMAPTEATSDLPIVKVAKKVVGDEGTSMNPHAAYFSKLEAVALRYGPETGHMIIRGISSGSDDSDEDEEEEEEDDEDTSKYTAEQMSTLRFVLINQKRQDRLDEMQRFVLGNQAFCGFVTFNDSYCNEVVEGFDRFKSWSRDTSPADMFDLLFAYTYTLEQYDHWIDNKYDLWIDDEGGLCGMVTSLAVMWKELLENDDEELNIDAEYTRPGVEEFLRNFKEKIEDYTVHKFNFQ